MADKRSWVFYAEWMDYLDDLDSANEAMNVLREVNAYAVSGIADGDINPQSSAGRILYKVMTSQIQRDAAKYSETSEKRREAVNKRWEK